MAIGRRMDPTDVKLDMTPMIDVVFQLLIFFMLTIKFKILEGKLAAYLPKDVGVNTTPAVEKEKVEIKLLVQREGTKMSSDGTRPWDGVSKMFKWGDDRVIKYSVGPKSSVKIEDIVTRMKELYRADKDGSVTIDPYPGCCYADVVKILDEVMQIGYLNVSFVGDRSADVKKN